MACTTILVGKKASYDGSTMIARNDDASAGKFAPKKFAVVLSKDQPRDYKSVISGVEIKLPDNPMRYTAMPNALKGEGIWAACGVNEANVGMTATETITSNALVLGADPLVEKGIGEEDIVVLTLPYIHSAREGVERLGSLLEEYGTYEMNGIGFSDKDEIWWLETIGGHHWIAKRVPDDEYVIMPNQQGISEFDLEDALTTQKEHMCSKDMKTFIEKHHLDLNMGDHFNARLVFGSHDDSDHTYNTPRSWALLRYFNPLTYDWDHELRPEDDDLPWSLVPERKITVEDVKWALSNHYQGTAYDPYGKSDHKECKYRPIGINRTDFLGLIQIRDYVPEDISAIEWMTYGSNVFNTFLPLYGNTSKAPDYVANTTALVDTNNFYWANRLIGALADAHFNTTEIHIERYQNKVAASSHALINKYDALFEEKKDLAVIEEANEALTNMVHKETDDCLNKVLYTSSNGMKNAFSRSDA